MKILVTGSSGFVGSHVAIQLLARGDTVIGLDDLNDYYVVLDTFADCSDLETELNYVPKVVVEEGVANFVKWFREFYKV